MKMLLLSLLMSFGVWAESPALFGKVIHVAKNDTLNVRSAPNYRAKKVAKIAPFLTVGIEQCKTIKSSTWCRVYALVQNWSDKFGDRDRGWVNATYLQFSNRGYVIVNGKKNCDYALRCDKGKCEVVYDYIADSVQGAKALKTKWLDRENLKGESAFGAMGDEGDGYCSSQVIEEYIVKKSRK